MKLTIFKVILVVIILSGSLQAATRTWTAGATGNFLDANAWSGASFADGDNINANNGTIYVLTGDVINSSTENFNIGNTVSTNTLFIMNGGNILVEEFRVGQDGHGELIVNGGIIETIEYIWVANVDGSTGNLTLNSGNLIALEMRVGDSVGETGHFNMYGGTVGGNLIQLGRPAGVNGNMIMYGGDINLTQNIRVGQNGIGNLVMHGGNINMEDFFIGNSGGGSGNFTMLGGNITLLDDFRLTNTTTSSGNFFMKGGTFTSAQFHIGDDNHGLFVMTGGNLRATDDIFFANAAAGGSTNTYIYGGNISAVNDIRISNNTGSYGNVVMFGGNMSSDLFYIGYDDEGDFRLEGGTVHIAEDMYLGQIANLGLGNFIVNEGYMNVVDEFRIANNVGTSGRFIVTGGNLNLGSFIIGDEGVGVFEMTGGNINTSNVTRTTNNPGSSSNIIISGGSFNPDYFYIGDNDTGYLTINGGNVAIVNNLTFGQSTDGYGIGEINSGDVSAVDLKVGNVSTGHLTINGGNIVLSDELFVPEDSTAIGNLILNNGQITTDDTFLGFNGTGNILINGGELNTSNEFVVGVNGNGHLVINGGLLNTVDLTLSKNAGSQGNIDLYSGNLNVTGDSLIDQNDSRIRVYGGSNLSTGNLEIVNGNMTWEHILTTTTGRYDEMGAIYIENFSTQAEGDLKIGVESGLMLSDNMSYYLQVGATQAASDNYDSKPNMWDISLVDNVDGTKDAIVATLASANKMSSFDINGTKEIDLTNSTSGWVSIENLDPAVQTGGVYVYLNVEGAVIQDLINDFNALGYTAQTTDAGSHDVEVLIPASFYASGTTYLTYDFRDITTGQATARLNQLQISATPLTRGAIFRLR